MSNFKTWDSDELVREWTGMAARLVENRIDEIEAGVRVRETKARMDAIATEIMDRLSTAPEEVTA